MKSFSIIIQKRFIFWNGCHWKKAFFLKVSMPWNSYIVLNKIKIIAKRPLSLMFLANGWGDPARVTSDLRLSNIQASCAFTLPPMCVFIYTLYYHVHLFYFQLRILVQGEKINVSYLYRWFTWNIVLNSMSIIR